VDLPSSELLRGAGLRRTRARVAVLQALHELGTPVTHAVLAVARALGPIDAVTLYRTLAALTEAGLVHRVPGTDGVWRYCAHLLDGPGCPGNHAHFVCTRCDGMRCLHGQPIPRVRLPEGARVEGRSFVAWGVCSGCAEGTRTGVPR